jgi:hypothetical protein
LTAWLPQSCSGFTAGNRRRYFLLFPRAVHAGRGQFCAGK